MSDIRVAIEIDIPLGLARWECVNAPAVSVYADWRVSGRGRHEAITVVEKHLREALAALPARGPAHTSLAADEARIRAYLRERADPGARGIVIFTCHAHGAWYARGLGVPVPTTVHVGDYPLLLPLAEVTQDATNCLVAVVDTEQLRLIDLAQAGAHELEGLAEDTWGAARLSSRAAWRDAHRQRAREATLHRFAAEVAREIGRATQRGTLPRLVLGGEDEIVHLVRDALSPALRDCVAATAHLDMRAPLEEVAERIWPEVRAAAAAARTREIDELLARAGGEADVVTGRTAVQDQLAAGRVETIAFDPEAFPPLDAEALLRAAVDQRARVLIARAYAPLSAAGGAVGALH